MVEEGQAAPDFELPTDDHSLVRLSSLKGTRVILYFYPRDDTPGCTTQACALRDAEADIDARDAVVVGVSPDPAETHAAFRSKHDLPFVLLADVDHAVAELYGVWREKNMYGRKFMGIHRSTFVIDTDGTVIKTLYGVRPKQHLDRVLSVLDTNDTKVD